MDCCFCKGSTKPRRVTLQHWLKGKLYIVENVEAKICTGCGERYFHAKKLDAIDAMLQKKHPVKRRLQVEVVRM